MWFFSGQVWQLDWYLSGCIYQVADTSSISSSPFLSIDVNECQAGSNRCDVNALCTNTKGSYVCRCINGYRGDGRMCEGNMNRLWLGWDNKLFYNKGEMPFPQVFISFLIFSFLLHFCVFICAQNSIFRFVFRWLTGPLINFSVAHSSFVQKHPTRLSSLKDGGPSDFFSVFALRSREPSVSQEFHSTKASRSLNEVRGFPPLILQTPVCFLSLLRNSRLNDKKTNKKQKMRFQFHTSAVILMNCHSRSQRRMAFWSSPHSHFQEEQAQEWTF